MFPSLLLHFLLLKIFLLYFELLKYLLRNDLKLLCIITESAPKFSTMPAEIAAITDASISLATFVVALPEPPTFNSSPAEKISNTSPSPLVSWKEY